MAIVIVSFLTLTSLILFVRGGRGGELIVNFILVVIRLEKTFEKEKNQLN